MYKSSTTLYFTSGSSDKEYTVHIKQEGEGNFHVICFNGRRGGPQKAQPKTSVPVSLAEAEKLYNNLVAKKKKDGYTEDVSGARYAQTEMAGRNSGWMAALLSPIDHADIDRYMRDDAWGASEKLDGERRGVEIAIECDQVQMRGVNKKGLYTAMPQCWVEILAGLPPDTLIDGEHMPGDILHVFDVVRLAGRDMTGLSFEEREKALLSLEPLIESHKNGAVLIVRTVRGESGKRALLKDIEAANGEGIVFVRWDAGYMPGEAPSAASAVRIKFKIQESATCIVSCVSNTKRSVAVCVLDEVGEEVPVGNVSIPANHDVPKVGDIVEVRFMYKFEGGCLFQPVYLGLRTDQAHEDAQLRKILRVKRKTSSAARDEGDVAQHEADALASLA